MCRCCCSTASKYAGTGSTRRGSGRRLRGAGREAPCGEWRARAERPSRRRSCLGTCRADRTAARRIAGRGGRPNVQNAAPGGPFRLK
ncbi:hypothetical protein EZV77_26340 [Burkholderia thailandensis]|nr:hypothetical protein A8H32_12325 [Burkholderia thailandensis]MDD1479414.1 hypothetical protein [Burkholderia thailandensis]MDD1485550.1 hypothetical protein [Burkholderia thailandensis]MDD1491285.1 hypothetical protein [Burkholderia thailandensis]PJO74145.1 hypothetical protein CWD92_00240 [Burkholderia thailandensis]